MNTGDVCRRVQRIAGDEFEAQIKLTDLYDWINDGQLHIIRQTECLQAKSEFSSVVGTESYALPATFLFERRVTFNDVALQRTTLQQLDSLGLDPNAESVPTFYYIWDGYLYLYPSPSVAGTNNIDFWYVKSAAAVDDQTDVLEIPVSFHEDLVRYCLMRAKEQNEDYQHADRLSRDLDTRLAESRNQAFNPSDSYAVIASDPEDLW